MNPADFYDALARHFHLIHPDWERSVALQGDQLDALFREVVPGARRVLDCACGIGTQSLGLAARGYAVTASDVARAAVARARREAAGRALSLELVVADMRALPFVRTFDIVVAADNSVPHLLGDDEIRRAFREFRRCTRPGGACVISVRDYAAMDLDGIRIQPHAAHRLGDSLFSVYQVRESEGETYVLHLYIVEDGDERTVHVARSRYYPVSTDRLIELFREAGFAHAERIDGRFFQPLLVAR